MAFEAAVAMAEEEERKRIALVSVEAAKKRAAA
jgi:hypothetical protein